MRFPSRPTYFSARAFAESSGALPAPSKVRWSVLPINWMRKSWSTNSSEAPVRSLANAPHKNHSNSCVAVTARLNVEVADRLDRLPDVGPEHLLDGVERGLLVGVQLDAARRFTQEIDSGTVVVNASTRFTDGEEFGFGAEIGISTQKLHARGPMGLRELTTYKYIVTGEGQIRS